MGKTAFITGATGYTGSRLAQRLAADGWQVKGLARSRQGVNRLKTMGCEPVFGDITDRESFAQSLQGVDVVFHLAAEYRTEVTEQTFFRVHVEGTRNVLEACIKGNVEKLVHCSTVGVHGHVSTPPADEDTPFAPGDAYQRSKLEAELLVKEWMEQKRITATIFRPAGIYGPGEMRFLKLFKLVAAPVTLIPGNGKTLYHLTCIDDLIDGILLCAEKKAAAGQTFILAGEDYATLDDITNMIAKALGKKTRRVFLPASLVYGAAALNETFAKATGIRPVLYRRRLDFFTKDRAFSIDRAKQVLGFSPQVGLAEGIARTAQWYRENGLLK